MLSALRYRIATACSIADVGRGAAWTRWPADARYDSVRMFGVVCPLDWTVRQCRTREHIDRRVSDDVICLIFRDIAT